MNQSLTAEEWMAVLDIPHSLAQTDPALYRRLREQITRFHLRGGGCLALEKNIWLARPGRP